ncbi:MAG: hypothetical protein HY332_11890 [Chloroflexi bacterium]|nr:hypothetical protein [Chloroflexota bacterium]
MSRPRIVSVMSARTYALVFSPPAEAKQRRFADFTACQSEERLGEQEMIRWLDGANAAIASWGVRFTDRAIEETNLQIIEVERGRKCCRGRDPCAFFRCFPRPAGAAGGGAGAGLRHGACA